MGFLDFLMGQPAKTKETLPAIISIMPDIAIAEIYNGRLPQLNTNTIFLKNDEFCHYIDKAILLKEKIKKSYVSESRGYSTPGFFRGRYNQRSGRTNVEEQAFTEQFRGILYVTNKRVVFSATQNGFEKQHRYLSTITPYSNAIELQYGSASFCLLVHDGGIVSAVLNLIQ